MHQRCTVKHLSWYWRANIRFDSVLAKWASFQNSLCVSPKINPDFCILSHSLVTCFLPCQTAPCSTWRRWDHILSLHIYLSSGVAATRWQREYPPPVCFSVAWNSAFWVRVSLRRSFPRHLGWYLGTLPPAGGSEPERRKGEKKTCQKKKSCINGGSVQIMN